MGGSFNHFKPPFSVREGNISQRVTDVLRGLKSTNKPYSNDLYVYDKVDGKLVENEKELKMLRKIHKLHKDGLSSKGIAKYLNERNYKTKRGGKQFYCSTIRFILNRCL